MTQNRKRERKKERNKETKKQSKKKKRTKKKKRNKNRKERNRERNKAVYIAKALRMGFISTAVFQKFQLMNDHPLDSRTVLHQRNSMTICQPGIIFNQNKEPFYSIEHFFLSKVKIEMCEVQSGR